MQNVYFNSLNAENKSAKRLLLFGILVALRGVGTPTLAAPTQVASTPALSASMEAPTLSASPTLDLPQIPEFTVQEAQKNVAKDRYQIGDRIPLLVEIKTNTIENGEKLSFKLPDGSSKLEDQGWYLDPNTQFLGGILRFVVSPIQTGKLILPTLLIVKENQSILGRTTAFTIQVSGPAKAEGKSPELLEISSISLPAKYWILFSLILLLALGGATYAFLRYYQRRSKVKPVQVPGAPMEADHVIALRKISSLFEEYPYSRENLKPLSFGLSEIMKSFFSKRFKVDANESTTDEMIELLRKEALSGPQLNEIKTLFQELDLIKFTKNENYTHVDLSAYNEFKRRAQLIVQKWALLTSPQNERGKNEV